MAAADGVFGVGVPYATGARSTSPCVADGPGVARHRPRERPRRAARALPQRLRLLLRRPGPDRSARRPLVQGRRLPAVVPGRHLHHPDQPRRRDLERIVRLRLSPLYVSLHAWDDDGAGRAHGAAGARVAVRVLRGSPRPGSRSTCRSCSARAGTTATVLRETLDAARGWPSVEDVGVVPVSLRRGRPAARRPRRTPRRSSALSRSGRPRCRATLGRAFVARRRRVPPALRAAAAGERRAAPVRERHRHGGASSTRRAAAWRRPPSGGGRRSARLRLLGGAGRPCSRRPARGSGAPGSAAARSSSRTGSSGRTSP